MLLRGWKIRVIRKWFEKTSNDDSKEECRGTLAGFRKFQCHIKANTIKKIYII